MKDTNQLIKDIAELNKIEQQGFQGNPLTIHTDGGNDFHIDHLTMSEKKELANLIGSWDSKRQRHIRKGELLIKDELLKELATNLNQ